MVRLSVCFVLLSLLFASVAVNAQPGQWNYIGPDPYYLGGTADAFGDITFTDSLTGYAPSAYNARMLKTTDGGVTWHVLQTIIAGAQMQFVNDDTGWITDGYTIAKTTSGGGNWIQQFDTTATGLSGVYFWSLQFINTQTGFVTAGNYVAKTNDGGSNWTDITPPSSIDSNWKMEFFLNPDTGWIFSWDTNIAKTYDGGKTWTRQVWCQEDYLWPCGVHFYDANNGVIISEFGDVRKTTDGGNSWYEIDSFGTTLGSSNVMQAKFGTNGLVYAVDIYVNGIRVSIDSGNTWLVDSITGISVSNQFGVAYFFNAQKGFLGTGDMTAYSGGSQCIFTTTNGGQTWTTNSPQFPIGYAIADYGWLSSTHAMAATTLGVIESYDGGVNWSANYSATINNIQTVNPTVCFMGGGDTGTYRYDNGVLNYIADTFYTFEYPFVFAKSSDSFLIGTNPNLGHIAILRTVDGGSSWDTIYQNYDSSDISNGEWWTADIEFGNYSTACCRFMSWDTGMVAFITNDSISNEYVTFNGGQSWHQIAAQPWDYIVSTKISPQGELFSLQFHKLAFASLWKLDSAFNWQIVKLNAGSPNRQTFPDFDWSFDNVLWTNYCAGGYDGILQYSLDEGNTWTDYPLQVNQGITMFKRMYNGQFIAGGDDGSLLIYDGSMYNCLIKGNVFYDFNRNGIMDGDDVPAVGYPVNISPTGATTFTDNNGNYITATDSGSYALSPGTQFNYTSAPMSLPVTFTGQSGVSAGNNFALQPVDTSLRDLAVYTIEGFGWSPGFGHTTWISYSNLGVQPMQPTITFTLDTALTYDSSSIPVSAQNGQTLTFNLPIINPLQSQCFTVTSTLSDSAQVFQLVTNTTTITPVVGDYNPSNNFDTSQFYVLGSYDPNFKTVNQTSIGSNQTNSQSTLMYTIHFQNTGTDSTHFVFVNDQLPASLNPATLRVIASSSPCQFFMQQGNVAVFKFANLQLPDSSVDPVGSNAFVSFVISPYAANINTDTIYNSASVYFDYNAAVVTNAAKTAVQYQSTDIKPVYGDLNVRIFPNPASNIVHVEGDNEFTVQFFDLWGRQVFTQKSAFAKMDFNVSNLASGMYFLRIVEAEKVKGFSLSVVTH